MEVGVFGTKECTYMLEYLPSNPYPSSNGKHRSLRALKETLLLGIGPNGDDSHSPNINAYAKFLRREPL